MVGLTHQNFLSAATGIALAVALIRGFSRSSIRTIGNFWVDVTRCTLYVLLPICVVYSLLLVSQGMPQTLGAYVDATTLEGAKQTIAVGPVASQVAIKMLGTNGGGFFNANAAHPFENPAALSNFVQMISIFSLGAALTNVFGRMVGNRRRGWAILAVMGVLFISGVAITYWAEANGTTALDALGLTGGNMEGKEVRFGIVASSLFAVITTAASCGAVHAMHDSFTALGGMIPLINMQLGEIIVGGVGAGLYGMLLFVVLAIFVAGLMVGRTPEYVGKKIEAREVKMAMLAILVLPLMYLGWTAVAVVLPSAVASMANSGPHGFTEVLYAYTSSTGNNGSGFAGLTGNTFFYNVTLASSMFVGRFFMIVPAMALAGSLAGKKSIPPSAGTLPTTGGLFVGLVVGVILIIGGLTFFPALALGPIVEHLAMNANTLFLSISFGVTSMEVVKMNKRMPVSAMLDPKIVMPAIGSAFAKLDPRLMIKSPVMFVVEVVAALTTVIFLRDLVTGGASLGFTFQIILWLWFTVLFANFAEAVAEGRGKAQAESLRKTRTESQAKLLTGSDKTYRLVSGTSLKIGDTVLVEAGDNIPSDGEVVEGVASVNEAAITGESAPVIRESGGDRSAVTGGTQVLSDWIRVRITAAQGSTFIDRMIKLVEGAERQKTPNEIALNILLAGLTIIFVFATVTIPSYAAYAGGQISVVILVALFVTLIPTTIGALLSAIGIAGMDRLVRFNVLAMSGRAVEAAGDVDTLLLDKTGTITLGNRQATAFRPVRGVTEQELADAAQLASLADETPEGRSIVVLAKEKYGIRSRDMTELAATFIPFTAQTRMSGVDAGGSSVRKGAVDAILNYVDGGGEMCAVTSGNAVRALQPSIISDVAREIQAISDEISKAGGTPLAVAKDARLLGVIHLKDIVKGGIRERFAELRRMGIRTVMITGDNPMTAAAIAAEAGVDDFLAQATPEDKLQLIRDAQAKGKLVAMCGDGTNDAPALAQADVGVAMNTGTQAAREAGNMVDLDSNPTKLIEVVEIGKQLLMTRGALTTFSIANDVAKYFAIIPAMFVAFYPQLQALNVMNLSTPQSAILSAIIFNALVIIALIPLALKGVRYRPIGAGPLLRRNLLIYGVGGVIIPFIGIKAIDLLVNALHLV